MVWCTFEFTHGEVGEFPKTGHECCRHLCSNHNDHETPRKAKKDNSRTVITQSPRPCDLFPTFSVILCSEVHYFNCQKLNQNYFQNKFWQSLCNSSGTLHDIASFMQSAIQQIQSGLPVDNVQSQWRCTLCHYFVAVWHCHLCLFGTNQIMFLISGLNKATFWRWVPRSYRRTSWQQ